MKSFFQSKKNVELDPQVAVVNAIRQDPNFTSDLTQIKKAQKEAATRTVLTPVPWSFYKINVYQRLRHRNIDEADMPITFYEEKNRTLVVNKKGEIEVWDGDKKTNESFISYLFSKPALGIYESIKAANIFKPTKSKFTEELFLEYEIAPKNLGAIKLDDEMINLTKANYLLSVTRDGHVNYSFKYLGNDNNGSIAGIRYLSSADEIQYEEVKKFDQTVVTEARLKHMEPNISKTLKG